jgi:hypothetical protein
VICDVTLLARSTWLDEVYEAATTPLPEDVRQEFEAKFGVRI